MRPLSVGLAGLGTVGGGVARLLRDNAAIITARAGRPITLTAVSARERTRRRAVALDGLRWYDDPVALAADPGLDVIIEAIGGTDGPARALVETALAAGRPVVTANKAMLAVHGAGLARLAEAKGVALAFEAAVAGGIPAIKALREGLAANRIARVSGILNGTCNYILSTMAREAGEGAGREFAEVLADAQRLGYAEADPSFDVDGIDAAHKLAILAALAFARPVAFADVHIEGIRKISALDFTYAAEFGYAIKLLGLASQSDGRVAARVYPCMIPQSHPLARVGGVFNAVVAEGDFVGRVMLEGRGAGDGPTASAIAADLIDIARGRTTPVFGVASDALSAIPALPIASRQGAYYLRLMVVDRPGVIADVSATLRDHAISLEGLLQRGRAPGEAVPVVLTTHECNEAAMQDALGAIAALDAVVEAPVLIRIERLD